MKFNLRQKSLDDFLIAFRFSKRTKQAHLPHPISSEQQVQEHTFLKDCHL